MAKRKKKRNWIWYVLIAALAILAVMTYFKVKSAPKGIRVYAEKAEQRTIKELVSASGKIFPETEVKISSDVSGEIVALYVEEGDSVRNGQLLAKIDPDAYQSAVERGVASVNNAKAQLANSRAGVESSNAQMEQIQVQLENAKSIQERNKKLHEEGVISDVEYEASLANLRSLEANLRSSLANKKSSEEMVNASSFSVKSAEASLKEIQTSLKRTTIYAPTGGVVSILNVEQGERVVGTIQMQGTELMRISNLNTMEVQVEVSEADVLRVNIGDPVEIEVDAYLDRDFVGVVTQIANSASNAATGMLTTDQVTNFVVTIRMDANSYKDLAQGTRKYPFRPGMSATVEINTQTLEDVLCVPIQSVSTREEEEEGQKEKIINEVVFLVSADTIKMQVVKTGIQDDNHIVIKDGLSAGDEVVSGPYAAIARTLEDGKEVKVVEKDEFNKKDKED